MREGGSYRERSMQIRIHVMYEVCMTVERMSIGKQTQTFLAI